MYILNMLQNVPTFKQLYHINIFRFPLVPQIKIPWLLPLFIKGVALEIITTLPYLLQGMNLSSLSFLGRVCFGLA